jgi:hypothetical protein
MWKQWIIKEKNKKILIKIREIKYNKNKRNMNNSQLKYKEQINKMAIKGYK